MILKQQEPNHSEGREAHEEGLTKTSTLDEAKSVASIPHNGGGRTKARGDQ